MGKDDVENSGTMKPAFLIRTLVKAYKTLAKEEPAMRIHAAREIALLRNPWTMAEALRTPQKLVLSKIKLASDGSIDKYKARCVVAGYRQTAGLDYDPEGV